MPEPFTVLLEQRRTEASVRGLAKLPHDFYSATEAYLTDMRRSYENDLRENPSGRKGEISRQTYQRASQAARDIVEGRVQKILTSAFQASIGASRELPNALTEERAMYDRILTVLLEHRRSAAPYIEPVSPAAPPNPPSSPRSAPAAPVATPGVNPAAAPSASATAPSPPAAARAPTGRSTSPPVYVRILKDGRPIEVGSETVDLRQDDVLSLPAETAKLLVDAQVAELVRTAPTGPVT